MLGNLNAKSMAGLLEELDIFYMFLIFISIYFIKYNNISLTRIAGHVLGKV